MRILLLLLCTLVLQVPQEGRAQQNAVVLELFTSQGCSSCPPADALLAELAERPGVIALALHVDYWDYLGWEDSFGNAMFSARQRTYAKWDGRRSVYTPQMIVQGEHMLVGHDREKIERSISSFSRLPPKVDMQVERDGSNLLIELEPREALGGPVDVHVVSLIPSIAVAIEAGENAGQHITYSSVVTAWETIGRWDGKEAVELPHRGLDQAPVAVILQRAGIGPVITAAKLP